MVYINFCNNFGNGLSVYLNGSKLSGIANAGCNRVYELDFSKIKGKTYQQLLDSIDFYFSDHKYSNKKYVYDGTFGFAFSQPANKLSGSTKVADNMIYTFATYGNVEANDGYLILADVRVATKVYSDSAAKNGTFDPNAYSGYILQRDLTLNYNGGSGGSLDDWDKLPVANDRPILKRGRGGVYSPMTIAYEKKVSEKNWVGKTYNVNYIVYAINSYKAGQHTYSWTERYGFLNLLKRTKSVVVQEYIKMPIFLQAVFDNASAECSPEDCTPCRADHQRCTMGNLHSSASENDKKTCALHNSLFIDINDVCLIDTSFTCEYGHRTFNDPFTGEKIRESCYWVCQRYDDSARQNKQNSQFNKGFYEKTNIIPSSFDDLCNQIKSQIETYKNGKSLIFSK
jgi:hypothetical protein